MSEFDKLPGAIITAAAEVYGVSVEDVMSDSRKRSIAEARQMAMFLCHEKTLLDITDIGIVFGRKHPTVIHTIRKVEGMLEFDRLTKRNYELITERLK
ncbi:MAG: hypothetical protein HDR82_09840 [Bacteroides sp.]|nr:hypothetical protein [Bacteroides sp.]